MRYKSDRDQKTRNRPYTHCDKHSSSKDDAIGGAENLLEAIVYAMAEILGHMARQPNFWEKEKEHYLRRPVEPPRIVLLLVSP